MNLDHIFTLVAKHGLGFAIDPKLRPGDEQYVTVYSGGDLSHSRKSFNTAEEMSAALEQCVAEIVGERSFVTPEAKASAAESAKWLAANPPRAATQEDFDALRKELDLDDFSDATDISEFG